MSNSPCVSQVNRRKFGRRIYYNVPEYFLPFDYALDRYSSVIHTRLQLDVCALNIIIISLRSHFKSSPLCNCGFDDETKTHFFLHCPNYAALRPDLLTAAARIVCDQWFRYSNKQKVELFLFGSTELTNSENIEIFSHVQHFIRESNRFSFSFSSHYN